jgi:hypothetical protein
VDDLHRDVASPGDPHQIFPSFVDPLHEQWSSTLCYIVLILLRTIYSSTYGA